MTTLKGLDPARHAGSALLSAQSDERLVALTRAGNARAFEAIVHRYRGALLRHCGRVLPPGRAEDAVQQAFVKAHAALLGGDAHIELRPWLYRIARNTALNLLREHGWTYDALDERIDGVERPPEVVERRELLRATLGAVQRLPPRQRDALVLRELEGRSYAEIAQTLTVSDGAVRQLLNRARETLRSGVTALTPAGLLWRFARSGRHAAPVEQLSAGGAGAGGLAAFAKLCIGALVSGAVIVGGGAALLHASSPNHRATTARGGRQAHPPRADVAARSTRQRARRTRAGSSRRRVGPAAPAARRRTRAGGGHQSPNATSGANAYAVSAPAASGAASAVGGSSSSGARGGGGRHASGNAGGSSGAHSQSQNAGSHARGHGGSGQGGGANRAPTSTALPSQTHPGPNVSGPHNMPLVVSPDISKP